MKDQKSIIIDEFESLYARGVSGTSYEPVDATPYNGFTMNDQIRYFPWGIQNRPGYVLFDTIGTIVNIVQIVPYHTNLNASPGTEINGYYLVSHTGGVTSVYDSNAPIPTTAIHSVAGAADFISVLTIFGRNYITYHNYEVGITSSFQVHIPGTQSSRNNGGSSPGLVGVNFASSGTAGVVTKGVHVFGLCFETNSGHFTAISDVGGIDVNFFTLANANQQVTATGLPNPLPAGIVATHILVSKLVVNPSTLPTDYELFFVAEDDGSTGSKTFNFSDESLVDSADYLYDLFGSMFCQLGFTWYSNRLIGWGEQYNSGATIGPSNLRVSESGLPESFSLSHGFVEVFRDDGDGGVKSAWEYKGLLIIQKENRTFVTRDNGGDPNTWPVDILDGTIGSVLNGVSRSASAVGSVRSDIVLCASKNGVYPFTGTFADVPLTWKIERLWQKYAEDSQFSKYQIIDIPTAKLFLILVHEVDEDNDRWLILYCDYLRGLDYQSVRWARWYLGDEPDWLALNDPTTLYFVKENGDAVYSMTIGTASTELKTDNTADITELQLVTGELTFSKELERNHYINARMQGIFTGVDLFEWIKDNGANEVLNLPPAALGTSEDITQVIINKKAFLPRIRYHGNTNDVIEFKLKKLVLFGKISDQDILNP